MLVIVVACHLIVTHHAILQHSVGGDKESGVEGELRTAGSGSYHDKGIR